MSDETPSNPKVFEQHFNDMIEHGRFFISTELTLHDATVLSVLNGIWSGPAIREKAFTVESSVEVAMAVADEYLRRRERR